MQRATQSSAVQVALALAVDRVTAEVVTALDHDGIPSILLKGPVLARWLYDDGTARPYSDSDVLVAPHDGDRSGATLRRLGFELVAAEEVPGGPPWVERKYVRRADRAVVDLHRGLERVDAGRLRSWDVLSKSTERMSVGGADVTVLAAGPRAFHVAAHALQHGSGAPKPVEDLRRACVRLPLDVWQDACCTAAALDATDLLAAGLRLVPEGVEIADTLGLPHTMRRRTAWVSAGAPRFSGGLLWLQDLPGLRAKIAFAGRAVFPAPAYLRKIDPRARGGALSLLWGYVRRWATLARHAPAALRAFARSARSGR